VRKVKVERFFHHKRPVHPITDSQLDLRDDILRCVAAEVHPPYSSPLRRAKPEASNCMVNKNWADEQEPKTSQIYEFREK
jgi:hypothetical protein